MYVVFYEQFIKLCNERDVKPSVVAEAIGLNKSTATGWKRGTIPTDITIQKLADYFGVERSYFSSQEADTLQALKDEERALLHSFRTMTEEQKRMMAVFIKGLKSE